MLENVTDDPVLALIHEGWDHLRRQRPIAAWASWRRALRLEPEQKAATSALHVLINAGDLPLAARAEYRFLAPTSGEQRVRWDARFRSRGLEELAEASQAFEDLAGETPSDVRARFNQGLCLAWLGRNAESVAVLDRLVRSTASSEPELAVDAWTLAEVVRQGGGAEDLADDLNHVVTVAWTPGKDPAEFFDDRSDVRPIPHPIDPTTGKPQLSEAKLYEWLDRRWGDGAEPGPATPTDLRRVRANVVPPARLAPALGHRPRAARGSGRRGPEGRRAPGRVDREGVGPRPARLPRRRRLGRPDALVDRRGGAGPALSSGRGAVLRGRLDQATAPGLDGRSPAEAGRLAAEGDAVALAKLSAVVRLREQLGQRPATAQLYQGYPFDRLRRRLGLAPTDPDSIDPLDAASMGGPELDKLDPEALDDYTLAEAYESAAALGDDRRTARFAGVLAGRDPSSLSRLDRRALFATLVRRELMDDSTDGATGRIDRAQAVDLALDDGRDRKTYETWRAEVYVRVGEPQRALQVYRAMVQDPPDPALALDAADTLLDAGFEVEAREMAQVALELGESEDDDEAIERAKMFLIEEG